MYDIYGNIYHQYTPNDTIYIYIPYMDPMDIGDPEALQPYQRTTRSSYPAEWFLIRKDS